MTVDLRLKYIDLVGVKPPGEVVQGRHNMIKFMIFSEKDKHITLNRHVEVYEKILKVVEAKHVSQNYSVWKALDFFVFYGFC